MSSSLCTTELERESRLKEVNLSLLSTTRSYAFEPIRETFDVAREQARVGGTPAPTLAQNVNDVEPIRVPLVVFDGRELVTRNRELEPTPVPPN